MKQNSDKVRIVTIIEEKEEVKYDWNNYFYSSWLIMVFFLTLGTIFWIFGADYLSVLIIDTVGFAGGILIPLLIVESKTKTVQTERKVKVKGL